MTALNVTRSLACPLLKKPKNEVVIVTFWQSPPPDCPALMVQLAGVVLKIYPVGLTLFETAVRLVLTRVGWVRQTAKVAVTKPPAIRVLEPLRVIVTD